MHLAASGCDACAEAVRLNTGRAGASGSTSADLRLCLRILTSSSLSSDAFSCTQYCTVQMGPAYLLSMHGRSGLHCPYGRETGIRDARSAWLLLTWALRIVVEMVFSTPVRYGSLSNSEHVRRFAGSM